MTLNRTEEASPTSAPRDLNIRSKAGKPSSVLLNWRPPKYPNGKINGYVIQYTTDRRAEDREWYVEPVLGQEHSAVIDNLEVGKKYYFKMGARNSKGYGPSGPVTTFVTPGGPNYSSSSAQQESGSNSVRTSSNDASSSEEISPVILYAVAGVGAGIIIVVVIGAFLIVSRCSKSRVPEANDRHNKSYLNGELGNQRDKLNPPPPDLWIGHDQLELKAMSDVDVNETGETSIARSTPIDYATSARSMSSTIDRTRGACIGGEWF